MKKLPKKTNGNLAKLARYSKKTLKISFKPRELSKPADGKTLAPDLAVSTAITGLFTGCKSGADLEGHRREVNHKLGRVNSESRSSLKGLLDEKRTLDWSMGRLLNLSQIANYNRLLNLKVTNGKISAVIDGLDLGEVHRDGGKCDLCIKRTHSNGEVRYFHKLVVISIQSSIGPIPIYFRFALPGELTVEHGKVSEGRFKQECELTCAKIMLVELAKKFGGKLPFYFLASDSLYPNAPFMELLESLGGYGVFVFKQETRKLYQQAKKDFCGNSLGFGVNEKSWSSAEPRVREFKSKWATYNDLNRKGLNKKVRVFETIRTEEDGSTVMGTALTSDNPEITPEVVEQLRFAKWSNLENGVFNELTNNWGTLKHIFFHKKNAIQSMIAIQLLCLAISLFYRYRNLTRGGRKHQSTLKEFLGKMLSDFMEMSKTAFIELFCNSPPIKG